MSSAAAAAADLYGAAGTDVSSGEGGKRTDCLWDFGNVNSVDRLSFSEWLLELWICNMQLELKETVKWKIHTQHQFIFPFAIPYMCAFFTFENNSRLLPSTKTQKYDFNKTRLALINSYTDFYTIKWILIWQCGWRRHGQLGKKISLQILKRCI